MAENESPDEISSIMERLWGPRGDSQVDTVASPRAVGPESPRDIGSEAEEKQSSGGVQAIEARHGEVTSQEREDLEAFQAQVAVALAELADKLARIGEHGAAAAADVEARVLARVDAVERATGERLAELDDTARVDCLEQGLNLEIGRLGTSVEATHADVSALRSELQADFARMLQEQRAELEQVLARRDEEVYATIGVGLGQAEADRAAVSELQTDLAAMSVGMQQFAHHQEDHNRALDDVTKSLGQAADEDRQAVTALSRRITEDRERVQALEARSEQSDEAISDLGDYHAALDVGMGAFRSEMARMRDIVKKLAKQQAEVSDRLDGIAATAKTGETDEPKGGKKTRR